MARTDTRSYIRRFTLALTLLASLAGARSAAADTLTVMWDFNTEPDVNGYMVFIGTQSGVYGQTVDVHNANTYAFANAVPGQRYYFAVAAYAGNLVSALSSEVSGVSNNFPILTNPGSRSSRMGQSVSLQLSASDPDGTALIYSATGLPPGLTLSGSVISGVPTTAGIYGVMVGASDGVLSAQQSFSWTILTQSQNTPPTLVNPGAMSSNVGQGVLLQLQGSDPEGDPLVYSASGLPAGLQLSASTGRITGTPTTIALYAVTATVSDGRAVANQSFVWTIRSGSSDTSSTSSPNPAPLTRLHPASSDAYTGTTAAVRPAAPPVEPTRTALRSPTGPGATTNTNASALPLAYTGRSAVTRSVADGEGSTTTSSRTGTSAMSRAGSSDGRSTGGLVIASGPIVRSVATATSDTEAVSTGSEGAPAEEPAPVAANLAIREPHQTAVTAPTSAPTVSIDTPVNQATFAAGTLVIFSGTAQDVEDGNLSAQIAWTSNVDGNIGTGALVTKALSKGTHTIRASVTDSRGNTRTAQVTIVVQ